MRLPIYQVDAFTDHLFGGNPAAVCPLEQWPSDQVLQKIAEENNLSETAYFAPEGASGARRRASEPEPGARTCSERSPEEDGYRLRWFTPVREVDLCGHATLASAFILFTRLQPALTSVRFASKSGPLSVHRDGELIVLDFPSRPTKPAPTPAGIAEAMGRPPLEVFKGVRDHLLVYGSEAEVRALEPDFSRLKKVDAESVIATARGDNVDFVSRFFVPKYGIDEDPVTGSAHCTLTPFWAERLGKTSLAARQVSKRGGELACTLRGDRVLMGGRAVLYLEGSITISIDGSNK